MAARKAFLLRVLLIAAACGWGVSFIGVFLPWTTIGRVLRALGASEVTDDPMAIYWVRGVAAAYGFVGVLFAVAAVRPQKHRSMILWLAVLMLGVGVASLVHGLMLRLPAFPFAGDVAFCLVIGAGLLLLKDAANAAHLR
jgi:hypothetical protein